ncbi:T9SS type A sorting domain-containing protein, partial [bacterium]|nr:T9SS type A sorting domain-containing protein [bacterium]
DRIRYEQGYYNDLQSMDGLHGYWVKSSSGTTQTWHITGNPISVTTPITLYSSWNLVGYLPSSSDNITHSLQSLDTLYSFVMGYIGGGGGTKSWDRVREKLGFYNDLQTLNPLFGYWIKMVSAKTLIYPSGGYSVPKITAPQNIYTIEQDTIIQTPWFCDFYGRQEDFLIEGDTIDVFDSGGIHCGRTFVVSQSRFTVHVYGDDPTTDDIDEGAVEGDTVQFTVNGDSASIKSGDNAWSYMGSKYIELGIKDSGIFNDRVDDLPSHFSLFQNYPNPFNSQTVISYSILTAGSVTIKIFDATGRIVNTLIHNRFHEPGQYNILWDGYDEEGKRVSSGIYIYQLRSDTIQLSKKMVLLY